jgi:hypothetical protein
VAKITFDEARTITIAQYYSEWDDIAIEPAVAEVGYENENEWLMIVGARQFIIEGDRDYQIFDDGAYIVNKRTGQLEVIPVYAIDQVRYQSFTRYGTFPTWLE